MQNIDMKKIYGFAGIEATMDEAIDFKAPQVAGRLGAKKGLVGGGGGGGEGK